MMKMRRVTWLSMISSKLLKSSSPKHEMDVFEDFEDSDTDGCSPTFNRYQYLFNQLQTFNSF